ncbi:putative NADH:ubiquinone oxidoreductase, subunit RnfC [Methanolobus tindarius DSM 2278]|uniref:Putative NADH:ubiquinone oxidoreductase, subunit RnfC n=1 Tax=Methanolobus tindarius DSM 2278 TaxID=1090322 RepID=W9DQ53_METTI|nr:Rnf electron transport complex subunit RnfC [Methanolobus tindarius]ETA68574.1 putative NADH:ubiquinone oxidoreductase, subunit RnfC [Methanolobus tindarius DSM 2278]
MDIKKLDTLPEKIIIPLRQHRGAVCEPLVKKGDRVLIGQKIGESAEYQSSAVHSSVCGEVIAIEETAHPDGNKVMSVIIQPEDSNESVAFSACKDVKADKLAQFIKESGIVEHYGMPTHTVLKPKGKKIDTVLINATSSEWIGGSFKTPGDYASQMIDALKLLMKAAGAKKGAIVLRTDDQESINAFEGIEVNKKKLKVAPLIGSRNVGYYFNEQNSDIVIVSQERIFGKKILNFFTYRVTGRKVKIGCDPTDVGVAVCGIKSAKALYDAVHEGVPFYDTVVSVEGVSNKMEYILVRIGTPFKDVIDSYGYTGAIGKIIANGVRTGVAQYTDQVPVTKGTTRITIQKPEEVIRDEAIECIHCARCVDVCPVELIPSRLAVMADQGRFDECRQIHIENCIECGDCAAVCPSKIPILQLIRYAKDAIEMAYEDMPAKESSNLKLGCGCGGE